MQRGSGLKKVFVAMQRGSGLS